MNGTYKRCNNCGKIVLDDSIFCEYCGSNDIESFVETTSIKRTYKKCNDCNSRIPDDSFFCPYCGSENILDAEEEISNSNETKQSILTGNSDLETEKIDNSLSKPKTRDYKIHFVVATIIAIICIVTCCVFIYQNKELNSNNYKLTQEVNKLNDKVTNVQKTSDKYKTNSEKYDEVYTTLANQKTSSSFCADYYFLKAPRNTKVTIRCTNYSSMYSQVWGSGISTEWGKGDGVNCYLYVTATSKACGYVLVHNNNSGKEFKIFVVGS